MPCNDQNNAKEPVWHVAIFHAYPFCGAERFAGGELCLRFGRVFRSEKKVLRAKAAAVVEADLGYPAQAEWYMCL